MNNVDKKYVILGSLCALVLMLAVGYAAFNAVLNIKGTTNISSSWDVKITNVTEKNKVGSATTKDKSEGQDKTLCKNELCNPTWNGLTASFEVDLVSPGDSIEYDITVSNEGDLNAKLDNIVVSDPDNEYITFETSGLAINDALDKKTSKTLTIKLTYKDVTIESSKPSSSNLTVTLDFSQADGNGSSTGGSTEPFTGTVYRYTTDELNIGDSIDGINITTNPSTLGKNYYLKHDVVDNIITASYVCFVSDTEHCMQGGNESYYTANLQLLREEQNEWFKNNGGSCWGHSGTLSECSGDAFDHVYASSDGDTCVDNDPKKQCGDGFGESDIEQCCIVHANGKSSCSN